MNAGFDINSLAGRSNGAPAAAAGTANQAAMNAFAMMQNAHGLAVAAAGGQMHHAVAHQAVGGQMHPVGHTVATTAAVGQHPSSVHASGMAPSNMHLATAASQPGAINNNPIAATGGVAAGQAVNPFVPGNHQLSNTTAAPNAAVNAANALASSVNLSSIHSLIDILQELPLPSESASQAAKQEVLITAMQQQQHMQSNLHTELMQQHYLTHQLAGPLLMAKQQMQDLNLQWHNRPAANGQTTGSEQNGSTNGNDSTRQFTPNHESNAFLLSLVQQKNTFDENVRLPPIPKHFTPTQQHTQSQQAQQQAQQAQQQKYDQQQLDQMAVPSARQTRSQAQPTQAVWNPLDAVQQQQQQASGRTPVRQNSNPYGNDNSNSSSSFSDASNLLQGSLGLTSGGSVSSTPTHQHPGMSPAMASGHPQQHLQTSGASNTTPLSSTDHYQQQQSVMVHEEQQMHQQQFQMPRQASLDSTTSLENGLTTGQQQFQQQHQMNNRTMSNHQVNNIPDGFVTSDLSNDAYSSLGDRVKSKKRSARAASLTGATTPQQQYSLEQSLPSGKDVKPMLSRHDGSNHATANYQQHTPLDQHSSSAIVTNHIKESDSNIDTNELQQQAKTPPHHRQKSPSHHQPTTSSSTPSSVRKQHRPKTLAERKERPPPALPPSPPASTHQLKSQNMSVPPKEKFEAMLNELIDQNSETPSSRKRRPADDDEYDEDRRLNGEAMDIDPNFVDFNLSSSTLMHFVGLTAKLKKSNHMKDMPTEKLSELIKGLGNQLAIQHARVIFTEKRREAAHDDDEDSGINIKQIMDKFEICCDCCLVPLNIMTSQGMPSTVYREECIEQIVQFLNATINKYTDTGLSSSPVKGKNKGKRTPSQAATNKKLLSRMYTKWSELIGCLTDLINIQGGNLADNLVIPTTRVATSAFFLESLTVSSSGSSHVSADSNEIQLNALNLICAIFAHYNKHRHSILEEIIHSISRLSTSKRGRVFYKIDGDEHNTTISMFSALVLKLIQSLYIHQDVQLQDAKTSNEVISESSKSLERTDLLKRNYNEMLPTAAGFMDSFLKKCVGGSDADFRVLFENLVNDLMSVLHKPNWPAAQVLTHILLKLLTNYVLGAGSNKPSANKQASNANINLQLRLCCLDHLGTICSRYAKELSCVDQLKSDLKESLRNMKEQQTPVRVKKEDKKERRQKARQKDEQFLESTESLLNELWKHLLRYTDEEHLTQEKDVFVSIWIKELERDFQIRERAQSQSANGDQSFDQSSNSNGQQPIGGSSTDPSLQEELDKKLKSFMRLYQNASNTNANSDEDYHIVDAKTAEIIIRYLDITMLSTTRLFDSSLRHIIASLSNTSNTTMRSRAMKSLSTVLNNAPRSYATSLLSRGDLKVAIKGSLMDASSSVREATIDLIGKFVLNCESIDLIDRYYDIIIDRILDAGVSVRKRVIKILREICLAFPSYQRVPEICSKIIKRVNDDGEGIRKLVTETFTSMWFKEEDSNEATKIKVECIVHVVSTCLFERIGTEWLLQLFSKLLTPPSEAQMKNLMMMSRDDEDNTKHPSIQQQAQLTAASCQIVNVLVREMLCSDNENRKKQLTYASITTLWLFAKVSPKLLVDHISVIQPFMSVRCTTQLDLMLLTRVVQIIEYVLPKLSNPSEVMLTSIEEELTKLILQGNPRVVSYCVACLSSLIHKHTKNHALVKELFVKFYSILQAIENSMHVATKKEFKPKVLRALFTCGLFAKHFDFLEQKNHLLEFCIKFVATYLPNENGYLYQHYQFAELNAVQEQQQLGSNGPIDCESPTKGPVEVDMEVLLKALSGLGFIFEGTPSFLLRDDAIYIYKGLLKRKFSERLFDDDILGSAYSHSRPLANRTRQVRDTLTFEEQTICCVLQNFACYLTDQLNSEMQRTIEWSKENLKSMTSDEGDTNSVQSAVIQTYLEDVLNCTLSSQLNIRKNAVNLIHTIHNGGIVHPIQLAPYLIAMSSDDDPSIRTKADHVLNEIERKYHGFVSMKAKHGLILSYQLHLTSGKRGYRIETTNNSAATITTANGPEGAPSSSNAASTIEEYVVARLSTLYSVVNNNRQSRRAFIGGLLKYFDPPSLNSFVESKTPLSLLQQKQAERIEIQNYICDNLIWLPYTVLDELLYIMKQFEHCISMNANQIDLLCTDQLLLDNEDDDEFVDATNAIAQQDMRQHDRAMRREQCKYNLLAHQTDFAVLELKECLHSFYTLTWTKQVLREIFSITDQKLQEYSVNDVQKIWDKPLHRKSMDVESSKKLMDYPLVDFTIDRDNIDATHRSLVNEYHRYRNIHLISSEVSCKNLLQMLKDPVVKANTANQQSNYNQQQILMDLSYSEGDNQAAMYDRSESDFIGYNAEQGASSSAANTPAKRKKKKKKEKHHKKKKRERIQTLTDSEEDEEEFEEDDDSDDEDYH